MAVVVNDEKKLETIRILLSSLVLSDQYKLKRIKEIVGTINIKAHTTNK